MEEKNNAARLHMDALTNILGGISTRHSTNGCKEGCLSLITIKVRHVEQAVGSIQPFNQGISTALKRQLNLALVSATKVWCISLR